MTGKIIAIVIVLTAALAGGGMYYLQVYHFYERISGDDGGDVMLTALGSGRAEPVDYQAFEAIDADSSPIRYRACFEVRATLEELRASYLPYERALPLTAPGWFECYDATRIGQALSEGRAQAFMGVQDITYGIDRVVVIFPNGQGYAWHQINPCGAVVFDGDPVPENCPPVPNDSTTGGKS